MSILINATCQDLKRRCGDVKTMCTFEVEDVSKSLFNHSGCKGSLLYCGYESYPSNTNDYLNYLRRDSERRNVTCSSISSVATT